MARFSLIPREEKFFQDFITMTDQVRTGAALLQQMLATEPPNYEKATEIKEVEHKCDFLAHEVIQRLHQTFITPLDREDIHLLAHAIDDVLDAIDDTAMLLPIYHIDKVRFGARELSAIIASQVDQLGTAVRELEHRRGVLERTVEVKRLEHDADEVHKRAVRQLFDDERDPITVIKWKEILDFLEKATDRCDDVANLLETVVVKHG